MSRDYYFMTKPGIVRANVMTATAGYLLYGFVSFVIWRFFGTLAGIALLIAGACVLNNYFDRRIDAHMSRTKKRALVTGSVQPGHALLFAGVLEVVGFVLLWTCSNAATVLLGAIAVVSYVGAYTWSKRHTWHGTLIGSIPGALPPAAAYIAASGGPDAVAIVLFLVMIAWQMPHFYAIAIFRKNDYVAAHIPVMSTVKTMRTTKMFIVAYMILFAALSLCLPLYAGNNNVYMAVMTMTSLGWLVVGLQGFRATDNERWAKKVFGSSLVVLLAWSAMLSLYVVLS